MSLARSQWISLVAATIPTITAGVLWGSPVIPDGSHWLAITATAVSGLLWSLTAHVAIVVQCHQQTRRFVEDSISGLAECVIGHILDESYGQIAAKVDEHRDAAADLAAARRDWRGLIDPGTPVDLRQWKAAAISEAAPRRRAATADTPAS